MNELKKLGIEIVYLIAGVAGAFVSIQKTDDTISVWVAIRHILSGGLTAMYLTPVINDVMRLNSSGLLFSAFVTGFMGYKAVDLAVKYLRKKFGAKQ